MEEVDRILIQSLRDIGWSVEDRIDRARRKRVFLLVKSMIPYRMLVNSMETYCLPVFPNASN